MCNTFLFSSIWRVYHSLFNLLIHLCKKHDWHPMKHPRPSLHWILGLPERNKTILHSNNPGTKTSVWLVKHKGHMWSFQVLCKLEEELAFEWMNMCLYWGKGTLFKRFLRFLKEMCLGGQPVTSQVGKLWKVQKGRKKQQRAEHNGERRRP